MIVNEAAKIEFLISNNYQGKCIQKKTTINREKIAINNTKNTIKIQKFRRLHFIFSLFSITNTKGLVIF